MEIYTNICSSFLLYTEREIEEQNTHMWAFKTYKTEWAVVL